MHNLQESPDNEALRELRDVVKDLNATLKRGMKSSERFTKALIGFALAQIILIVAQLAFPIVNQDIVAATIFVLAIVLLVAIFVHKIFDVLEEEDDEDTNQ